MSRILVVDDDAGFRSSLVETLQSLGHLAVEAATGAMALDCLEAGGIDAVILDYRLGSERGTDVLRTARERLADRLPPVIMLTAHADTRGTIEAMSLGAYDHLTKPIGRETLVSILRKATMALERQTAQSNVPQDQFIGASPAMREVHKLIGRAAASDATVLISGETGTGKEVAARTLHDFSARASGPFVAVNCAAIPAELLEAELFGHGKGAFSGAVGSRAGCFERADTGTLMLDEIGDMPLAMQAKILRVLQERTVVRLGESQERPLNVRIIAATHRDLQAMVQAEQFRQDLFYRLNVLRIEMPPLRDRTVDIVPLANLFLRACPGQQRSLSAAAGQKLEQHRWPGNVRELRNAIERVCVMTAGPIVDEEDLAFLDEQPLTPVVSTDPTAMPSAVASLERDLVVAALAQAGGNRSDAARRLGISRAQLYRKLRSLGISD